MGAEPLTLAALARFAVGTDAMRAARRALLDAALGALGALAPAAAQAADPPPRIAIRLSYVLGPGTRRCPPEQVDTASVTCSTRTGTSLSPARHGRNRRICAVWSLVILIFLSS